MTRLGQDSHLSNIQVKDGMCKQNVSFVLIKRGERKEKECKSHETGFDKVIPSSG